MDTRDGTGLGGRKPKLASGAPITLKVAVVDGIPQNVTAVAVNLTLTNSTGVGNVAAGPTGFTARPPRRAAGPRRVLRHPAC